MLGCCLIEHGEKIHGQLRPATIDEKDVLVFIKYQSEKAYLEIPASKLASAELKGFFNKTLTVTAKDGLVYHFKKSPLLKGSLSQIYKLVTFLIVSNVEDIEISVDAPDRVFIDETFELIVTVHNKQPENIKVAYIWLNDYLPGLEIVSFEPSRKSPKNVLVRDDPGFSHDRFKFDETVHTSATKRFTFELQAKKQRNFSSHITVSGDFGKNQSFFLTADVQTNVIQR